VLLIQCLKLFLTPMRKGIWTPNSVGHLNKLWPAHTTTFLIARHLKVKSGDCRGHSSLEIILSSKKYSEALTHNRSVWIALHWHATLTQSPILTAADTGTPDTSATLFVFVLMCACLHNPVSCSAWNYVCGLLISCWWMFWLGNYTNILGFES
jgi:hypothetical protein